MQNYGRTALFGGFLQVLFGGFSFPLGLLTVFYGYGLIPVGIFLITLWSTYKSYRFEDQSRKVQAAFGLSLSLIMILLNTFFGAQLFDMSLIGLIVN